MLGKLFTTKAVVIFPVLLIFIVSIFAIEMSTYVEGLDSIGYDGKIGPGSDTRNITVELDDWSGYLDENTQMENSYQLDQKAVSMHLLLEWEDEAAQQFYENQPDIFQLTVISPSGVEMASSPASNPIGERGRLELSAMLESGDEHLFGESGEWVVVIQAGDCGDQTFLIRTIQDAGNDFSMELSYDYQESYYSETWMSWRGVVMTIMGLISIMVGIFLLHVSTKENTLREMIESERFPVFTASLMFLFNGLGLFADGASGFLWDPTYYLWTNFIGPCFYTFTFPLLVLFPLYYPRTLHRRLEPFRTRILLLACVIGTILLFWTTQAVHKEWFYIWDGYVTEVYDPFWFFFNNIYFAGIIISLVVFTYWYKFGKPNKMEKNALAFLIAGFIFTPLNQWDEYEGEFLFRAIGKNLEAGVATAIAIFLLVSGLLLMYRKRRVIKREAFLIITIITAWLFLFALNDYVIFGLEGYYLGFSLIRPICFTIAILQFRMFNINITQRVILYGSLSLLIGLVFFMVKNGFQAAMPALGFLSIFLITALFLPLSAFTNYFSERLAPKLTGFIKLSRDTDSLGILVEDEPVLPLSAHFKKLLKPRVLLTIFFFGVFIEILENSLNDTIGYPELLSIVYVGILFSALDYLLESSVLARESDEGA